MTPGINASDISEDACDLPRRTGRKKAVCYAARVRQDLFTEVSSLAGGVEIQHFSRSTRFARPVSLSQVHTQVNQGSRRCQDLTVGSIVWKASPDATPRLTAPLIPSSCTLSSYPFFYFHRQNKSSETDCRIYPFLFLQDNGLSQVEKWPCSTCNKLRIFEKKNIQ